MARIDFRKLLPLQRCLFALVVALMWSSTPLTGSMHSPARRRLSRSAPGRCECDEHMSADRAPPGLQPSCSQIRTSPHRDILRCAQQNVLLHPD